jgi:uncharacterized membrane-anchored protein
MITIELGLALLIGWFVLPQALNVALVPITLIIVVRSGLAILE